LCDIFKATPDILGGECDYLWDRGALVAMNYDEKEKYSQHIHGLLSHKAQCLIESIYYDRSVWPGPPYSVTKDNIMTYFSDHYSIEEVIDRSQSELPEWYAMKYPGLYESAHNVLYYLKRK